MQIQNINQSLEDYLSSVYVISHSYSTYASYRLAIVNKNKTGFRDFIQQKYSLNEFQLIEKVKNDELGIYKILREFIVFLDQQNYKPKSIFGRLAAIKGYLRYLGLRIYSEDYKQNVRLPKNIRHREEPLTKEIIIRVLRNVPAKLQTIILVLTASGMRIGELVQLKLSDIDFSTQPTTIRIRAETTKTLQSRETFLTSEATNSLKDYLSRFFGWKEGSENTHLKETLIFGRTSLVKSEKIKNRKTKQPQHLIAEGNLMKSLSFYLEKIPELYEKNPNGRNVVHFHALRKFFRTAVGNVCGRDFAEALIGHGFYMDTYYQLPEEKKREMYLQAEPYLTITDFQAVEKNLKTLSTEYMKLKQTVDEIKEYLASKSIPVPEYLSLKK